MKLELTRELENRYGYFITDYVTMFDYIKKVMKKSLKLNTGENYSVYLSTITEYERNYYRKFNTESY